MLILPKSPDNFSEMQWLGQLCTRRQPELPGRLCSLCHMGNLASWEGKEQPSPGEETSLHSCRSPAPPALQMCRLPWDRHHKPLHQSTVARSRSTALTRSLLCSAAISISEFQQPRSFTSLCKSLLSLD